jgi:putative phage-type endonuclease
MSVTVITPKDRAEWLELRKSGIGSSEVATILGLNPYETPYQLWRRRKGLDAPKEDTPAMKAGRYLEDAVARYWAEETGHKIIPSSAADILFVNSDKDFLRASPDRLFRVHGENTGILECKTTQKDIDPDDVPNNWFLQLQYQLGVAELEYGALAWLTSGRDFGCKNFAFVPDLYGWMCDNVEKFWMDNILGDKEPEIVSIQDIQTKYVMHMAGKVIQGNNEFFDDCLALKEVKEKIKELEGKKHIFEDAIKTFIKDAEAVMYGGEIVATWKSPKDTEKLDSNRLFADHPELKDKYTVSVPGARRLLIK